MKSQQVEQEQNQTNIIATILKTDQQYQQLPSILQELYKELNIDLYRKLYQQEIIQMQLETICQISKAPLEIPSRTIYCPSSCLINKHVLAEYLYCACGRQIYSVEQIKVDEAYLKLLQYLRQKKKLPKADAVLMLKNKKIEPIIKLFPHPTPDENRMLSIHYWSILNWIQM